MPALIEQVTTAMAEMTPISVKKADNKAFSQLPKIEDPDSDEEEAEIERLISQVADGILDIVQSHGMHTKSNGEGYSSVERWEGRSKFRKHVEHWIRHHEAINFVIPSYPFKSENPDKVTSTLPDMAEYIGLCKLHAMTLDIQHVYSPGAFVTVASDGAAFNDVYPTSDEKVWQYSQAINQMTKRYNFNVRVASPHELLKIPTDHSNRESYIEGMALCRKTIAERTHPEKLDDLFANDPDSLRTYTQMSRFYEVDLKYTPVLQGLSREKGRKTTKKLARATMARSEAFTGLILEALPHHVRLSVHASTGAVKLSFPLVPQGLDGGSVLRVPWMSSIAVTVDGKFESVFSGDVRETHDLVYKDDLPWCFRERHDHFNFANKDVILEHIYPRGLMIINDGEEESVTLATEDVDRVEALAKMQPVYVFGFDNFRDGRLIEDGLME